MTTYRPEPRNAESQVRGVMSIAWIINCRQRRMLCFRLVIVDAIALKSRLEKCSRIKTGQDGSKQAATRSRVAGGKEER